jgi:hypothetical protein
MLAAKTRLLNLLQLPFVTSLFHLPERTAPGLGVFPAIGILDKKRLSYK